MIHHIALETDEGGYCLILEGDFGTSHHVVDPDMLVAAVQPYLAHLAEGAAVRQERVAAGAPSWEEYREAQARTDPEWAEGLAEAGDLSRKRKKEEAA